MWLKEVASETYKLLIKLNWLNIFPIIEQQKEKGKIVTTDNQKYCFFLI